MDNKKQIDDIVNMIDTFMAGNGGHMNISVAPNGKVELEEILLEKVVQQTSSLDCASGDVACKVPTLFEGLDSTADNN
jgi:hypothetical protein